MFVKNRHVLNFYVSGWVDVWMGDWVDVKAVLRGIEKRK
jgi:hypothetical protein